MLAHRFIGPEFDPDSCLARMPDERLNETKFGRSLTKPRANKPERLVQEEASATTVAAQYRLRFTGDDNATSLMVRAGLQTEFAASGVLLTSIPTVARTGSQLHMAHLCQNGLADSRSASRRDRPISSRR
jgi:hypothetical protein